MFKWCVLILLEGVITSVLPTWNKENRPCFEKERKYVLYYHTLNLFDIDPVRIKEHEYGRFGIDLPQ